MSGWLQRKKYQKLGSWTANTMLTSGYTVMERWTSDDVEFTAGEVAAQDLRLRPNRDVQLGGCIAFLGVEVETYLEPIL